MEAILAHLKTRGVAAEKHPILEYFRDTSVPAEERLTKWLFHATQFILGFRDFCNLCLRFPAEEAENVRSFSPFSPFLSLSFRGLACARVSGQPPYRRPLWCRECPRWEPWQ